MTPSARPEPSDRDRILEAITGLVAEFGYRSVKLDQVLLRADLDRATFDHHFQGLDDCFAAAWQQVDEELGARMAAAFGSWEDWQERLRAALLVGLGYLATNKDRARLYIDDAVYGVDALRSRQQTALTRLGEMIECGRQDGRDGYPAHFIAEAICGAIWHRIQLLLRTDRAADLVGEIPQLMYFAVLPYRGTVAAEAELRRRPLTR